jgi:hypothetical protein
VQSLSIAGRSIAAGSKYRVAMTRSLAQGALGYFRLWRWNDDNKPHPTVEEAIRRALDRSADLPPLSARLRIRAR